MAVIVFGAGGGLGQALVNALLDAQITDHIFAVSRQPVRFADARVHSQRVDAYEPEALAPLQAEWQQTEITGVLSAIGLLHTADYQPEKRLAELNLAQMQHQFTVNAALPMLLLQQTLPLLPTKSPSFWVQLSAMVGSITDNKLGGWYSYRASKAALNMLMKTAAIELARTHKQLKLAAIHPGTTDTALSKPFQARLPADKLYTPAQSATRIVEVIQNLTPAQSGGLFHWDGTSLPY